MLELAEWIRGAGAAGVALYSGLYMLGTLLFFPGALLTLVAGFAYGPLWGTLIVWPTATIASALAFLAGRFVARDWVAAKARRHPRFGALDEAVGRRGFRIVLLLRLSPIFPFNFLNYTLGVTSLKLRHYVLASFLGMLPGTAMYVYLGSLVTSATQLASGHPSAGRGRFRAVLGRTRGHRGRDGGPDTLGAPRAPARHRRHERRSRRGAPMTDTTTADTPSGRSVDAHVRRFIQPNDEDNRRLIDNVHPASWQSPEPAGRYNLVVVGGGTAGLVSAMGAAGLGARVALVERHLLGGDCLVSGCVPSKALLHAARVAHVARHAGSVGISSTRLASISGGSCSGCAPCALTSPRTTPPPG